MLKIEGKEKIVKQRKAELAAAESILLMDSVGLDANNANALRAVARKRQVQVCVVKNTLLRRAVEGTQFEQLKPHLVGSVIVLISTEGPSDAAKVVVDFSKDMLNQIPEDVYKKLELVDLNKPLKYSENNFDAIICVGTFTYGHVKANSLNEFIRITKKMGLICFTVNEGIYKKYQFDEKDIEGHVDEHIYDVGKKLYKPTHHHPSGRTIARLPTNHHFTIPWST